MFALKRLEDAEAHGDHIYAVIRGLGSSSDGKSKSIYAPRAEGQMKALRRAYDVAGYGPETVELVEAHGTGTIAGDAAEFTALDAVFSEAGAGRHQWCALGSVKSQIGHTKAAAGAAGLFKAVMALHHKILPPSIKISQPNPALHIEESPFYLNTQARPWMTSGDHPRRAAVSSFGFGGSNFHVTLEEYQGASPPPPKTRYAQSELFVISAADGSQLVEKMRALQSASGDFDEMARASHKAYSRQDCRVAIIAADLPDLKKKLAFAIEKIEAAPGQGWALPQKIFYGTGGTEGHLGFVFPGQGSQYTQMGADIAMNFDVAREVWDAASKINPELRETVFPRPGFGEEAARSKFVPFKSTSVVQPAIAAMSAALLALLKELGIAPFAVAGHSLGELSALYSADAIDFTDLLRVCKARGKAMEKAGKDHAGAMLAAFASEEALAELINAGREDLVGANFNHPQQTVLSGSVAAMESAASWLSERGIAFKVLPVSGAFHSPLMQTASQDFSAFLQSITFRKPRVEIFNSAGAASTSTDAVDYREYLAAQILMPVRFIDQIKAMYQAGVRTFIEVGPGNILQSFITQILGHMPHQVIALDKRGANGLDSLWEALARLIVAGIDVDLAALWNNVATSEGQAAKREGRMTIPVIGANPKFPRQNNPVTRAASQPAPRPDDPMHKPIEKVPPSAAAAMAAMPQREAAPNGVDKIMHQDPHSNSPIETNSPDIAKPQVAQSDFSDRAVPPAEAAPDAVAARRTSLLAASRAISHDDAPVAASPQSAPAAAPSMAAPAAGEISGILMEIIAEMTGYPVEMLETHMELEADLGVDSIKRIEIFSALRQRVPSLPEVDAAELSALRSLDQIIARLGDVSQAPASASTKDHAETLQADQQCSGDSIAPPSISPSAGMQAASATVPDQPSPPSPLSPPMALPTEQNREDSRPALAEAASPQSAPAAAPSMAAPAAGEISGILMEIIAEMTGYPVEMLETHMELEADLGVDSIKRIEIFSALRQRVPSLPEVDAAELGALRSLDQIIARLGDVSQAPASASTKDHAETLQADQQGSGDSIAPPSISPSAGMQAASATVPDQPSPPSPLSPPRALPTEQNREDSRPALAEAASPQSTPAAAPSMAAPAAGEISGILMEIIAEMTGYPVEMLETHMELEADLGVDSIKRIEIFSALRQRVPSLPEVDAAELSALRSLDQIIARLSTVMSPHGPEGRDGGDVAPGSTLDGAETAPRRPLDDQTSPTLMKAGSAPDAGENAPASGQPVANGHAKTSNDVELNGHDRHHALTRSVRSVTAAPLMRFSSVSFGRRVFLAGDHNDVNEALAQHLAARGMNVDIGHTPPEDAETVIFSFGLHENPEFADTVEAARRLFDIAHKVAPRFEQSGGVFVTLQDTGGDFGLSGQTDHPWVSGFTAFASSAAKEWPKAHVKAIDIECGDRQPEDIAAALELELLCGWDTNWVGLREDGQRSTITKKDTNPVAHRSRHLRAMDVILVTGGARGITNAVLQSLTAETKLRIALLGRQALIDEEPATQGAMSEKDLKAALIKDMTQRGDGPTPALVNKKLSAILKNREIHENLKKLTDAGNEVRYFSVNIQDEAAVDQIVQKVRTDWGLISGLIHGAGELVDKKISALTREEFERVYRTKVIGLRNLLKSTEGEPLRFISLFSSIVASSGNPGQLAYGMANSVLNGVAAWENRRRGQDCNVRSIMWGPWHGGMVTPDLQERFKTHGIHCIPLNDGALAATDEVFDADASTAEVIITANGFA
ncbi:hypothetical protein CGLAMM_02060 [Acetobacteraceae bacterium EV16G]